MNENRPSELVHLLFANKNVRVERIFSLGVVSPDNFWYDQDDGELVLIERGDARIEFDDGGERSVQPLSEGDYFYITPHRKHRVTYTSQDCVWNCVFVKEK
ncbi:MAG: cupin [Clostridia bacterium]